MTLKLTKNFAILYGILLGDGCLSLVYGRKKFISITGNSKDDVPFFNTIIKPILKRLINKDIPIKFRKNENTVDLNFVNKNLFDFFQSFGFPVGKKGNQLFIPKVFYEKNLVKYLIRGFFATDGSLVLTDNNGTLYPRVEANGIAKNLIKEISDYLNSVGIKSNLYIAKRRVQTGYLNHQEQYRIQINGKDNLKKYVKLIEFVNPKQIERLGYYYKKSGCSKI